MGRGDPIISPALREAIARAMSEADRIRADTTRIATAGEVLDAAERELCVEIHRGQRSAYEWGYKDGKEVAAKDAAAERMDPADVDPVRVAALERAADLIEPLDLRLICADDAEGFALNVAIIAERFVEYLTTDDRPAFTKGDR
jgi:flagellar biosynthesis/type III secretory pathway protein FliH